MGSVTGITTVTTTPIDITSEPVTIYSISVNLFSDSEDDAASQSNPVTFGRLSWSTAIQSSTTTFNSTNGNDGSANATRGSKGLSTGAMIGIAAVCIFLLLSTLILCLWRFQIRKKRSSEWHGISQFPLYELRGTAWRSNTEGERSNSTAGLLAGNMIPNGAKRRKFPVRFISSRSHRKPKIVKEEAAPPPRNPHETTLGAPQSNHRDLNEDVGLNKGQRPSRRQRASPLTSRSPHDEMQPPLPTSMPTSTYPPAPPNRPIISSEDATGVASDTPLEGFDAYVGRPLSDILSMSTQNSQPSAPPPYSPRSQVLNHGELGVINESRIG
jgi:hypothetical protein